MAFIAKFIGVDRYADPNIRDLSGAKNDALALWALFTDTVLGIESDLLTGPNATVPNIKKAIEESLTTAKSDDTVVLFYSGHGSQDHRITGFDTSLSALEQSTISMKEIAEQFKKSKAKSLLCILDCCFSGGAPAKVLEDSPIARNTGNPLDELAGEGRMIIAASNFDEPSYELPSTGHGILTKAIIDVLQTDKKQVNMLEAMNDVMEIVRAEANRIGLTQTPVLLNHITGGLSVPGLQPGSHYFQAFPERKGARISNDIKDLTQFGVPDELVAEWGSYFKDGLNDLQLQAINDYRILDGDSLLVIAPTSSGKTFVGEIASSKAMAGGKKTVFLFPYRALVNEKYDQFSALYGDKLGYRVIRSTGDYLDDNDRFIKGKYDIALFTYEMFLNMSISIPSTLNQIGLVVLDEAQFITDPTRGITVELLLTNLIAARSRGVEPQLVVLSAVIGDSNLFEDWLGCKKLQTTERPVPLVEGVMGRDGRFKYLSEKGEVEEEQLLPPGAIQQRRDKPSQQDMIVPLAKSLVEAGEKVIVFRNQRGYTEGCANYLAEDLGLPAATDELEMLPKYTSSSASPKLRKCFEGGTAFHNSNLSRDEKLAVERVYRDPKSKIRVLAATTTVAAGINTPASTVILAEQEFRGDDGRLFTIAEYKNMAGRAGRVGFNEKGKAIILADGEHDPEMLFRRFVQGVPEPLTSSFNIVNLDTWIIRLLAQVKDVNKTELVNLLANTYGGYVANRKNPDWEKEMRHEVTGLYDEMLRLEIIEEEGDIVHLTILGKTCGESVLSFRSAMRLVELLQAYPKPELTAIDFMALVQVLPESDKSYTPMFKRGTSESGRQRQAAERYGNEITRLLQKYSTGDEFVYYARCKRACILYDWVNGVPTEKIEESYKSVHPFYGNISYGDISRFADFTRFQLRSAHKIAALIFPGQMLDDEAVEKLLKSLEVGLPGDHHELLELPVRLSREEYLALASAGISTKQGVENASVDTLKELLEETNAAYLSTQTSS